MIYFLNGINMAPKVQICIIDLLVKSSWMQFPLHNQIVNKPDSHGASCQLAPSNIWTHRVQYLPTAVYWWKAQFMRNEYDNCNKTCWIQF